MDMNLWLIVMVVMVTVMLVMIEASITDRKMTPFCDEVMMQHF